MLFAIARLFPSSAVFSVDDNDDLVQGKREKSPLKGLMRETRAFTVCKLKVQGRERKRRRKVSANKNASEGRKRKEKKRK